MKDPNDNKKDDQQTLVMKFKNWCGCGKRPDQERMREVLKRRPNY